MPIITFLSEWGMEPLEDYVPHQSPDATRVFVNGVWHGVHRNPARLMETLRTLRRKGDINPEVSMIRDIREKELKIFTDAGRVYRPLFIVEDDESLGHKELKVRKGHIAKLMATEYQDIEGGFEDVEEYTWSSLLNEGLVEYIDAEEEESILIAMQPEDLEPAEGNEENDLDVDPAKPVSYTHLDVYKRQVQEKHCIILIFSSIQTRH